MNVKLFVALSDDSVIPAGKVTVTVESVAGVLTAAAPADAVATKPSTIVLVVVPSDLPVTVNVAPDAVTVQEPATAASVEAGVLPVAVAVPAIVLISPIRVDPSALPVIVNVTP